MGEFDFFKLIIECFFGGIIYFGRVNMKFGKFIIFVIVLVKNNDGMKFQKMIFSFFGNFVLVLVMFYLFVFFVLYQLVGISLVGFLKVLVVLGYDFFVDKLWLEYYCVMVIVLKEGKFIVISIGGQRSFKVGSLEGVNVLFIMLVGNGLIKKGEKIEVLMMGELRSELV